MRTTPQTDVMFLEISSIDTITVYAVGGSPCDPRLLQTDSVPPGRRSNALSPAPWCRNRAKADGTTACLTSN